MKRIFSALIIVMLVFSGCSGRNSGDSGEESSGTGDQGLSDVISEYKWSNEELNPVAKKLLEADKLITDLFVGGLLTTKVNTENVNPLGPVSAAGTEYEDFFKIEKLLDSTYSVADGVAQKFLSFPKYGNKSIFSVDGKTFFSFHYREMFDYPDINTAEVTDSSENNKKIIKIGGSDIGMLYDGAAWLLSDSVYFMSKGTAEDEKCELPFAYMNQGSAKAISGKILVAEIYVSDKKSSLTDEQKAKMQAVIGDSFEFISKKAKDYGRNVEFVFKQLSYKHKAELNFTVDQPYEFDFALADTKYSDLDKYITKNFDTTGYDGYMVIICVNKKGSGYSLPFTEGESAVFSAERCVLFPSDSTGLLTKNILSLFGAEIQTDKYLSELIENYSPHDIMAGNDVNSAELNQLTAYQTGIINTLNKQFYPFYTELAEK